MEGRIFLCPCKSVLFDIDDLHSFSDLSTFAQHIPWFSGLSLRAGFALCRRRFAVAGCPADQVLWLVLPFGLVRNEPVSEVARRLNICAQGLASEGVFWARSGVSQARQRLGAEPSAVACPGKPRSVWGHGALPRR